MTMQFLDRAVTYERFLIDVAEKVIERMREPEYICQNEAFRRFGRKNVERWRRKGMIEPCVRPHRVEYRLAELKKLQTAKQDYFQ